MSTIRTAGAPASDRARRGVRARPLAVFIAVVLAGMLPWTGYLAYTLPGRYDARNWNVLWVGFDVALIVVLGYTAWAAWFRRQVMIATAIVSATLLLCDAWFDVVTSFGGKEEAVTLLTALGAEVPLAALLIGLAWRGMVRTVTLVHELTGGEGKAPRLRNATMLAAWVRERRAGDVDPPDARPRRPPG